MKGKRRFGSNNKKAMPEPELQSPGKEEEEEKKKNQKMIIDGKEFSNACFNTLKIVYSLILLNKNLFLKQLFWRF